MKWLYAGTEVPAYYHGVPLGRLKAIRMTEELYRLQDYDYLLPPERIAQRPAEPRDSSRLMVLSRGEGTTSHAIFRQVGEFLSPGDLLVLNDTRVFPARTFGLRSTGGRAELFFLRDQGEGQWEAMLRCHGKPKNGEYLEMEPGNWAVKLGRKLENGHWIVIVPRGMRLMEKLQEAGHMPLPPYIHREGDRAQEAQDRERYQTVYARESGAVAAPTAGLHFTRELLESLQGKGIGTALVTLHVGAGTFQPIKVDDIRAHKMHEEYYTLSAESTERILAARAAGRRIVAVGTTACRVLESAAARPEGFGPGSGWTGIYIYPPYQFKMTDALLTNFHLPRSTLLLLVCAFAGRERILAAYEEARQQGYRFYSYGDAMLIL